MPFGLPCRGHGCTSYAFTACWPRTPCCAQGVVPPGPPAQTQAGSEVAAAGDCDIGTVPTGPHRISWARLLKRVLDIDMQHCPNCGAGELEIIATILWGEPGRKRSCGPFAPGERQGLCALAAGDREDPHPPGAGSAAAAQGAGARAGDRLRRLSRAGRHEHHAPGRTARPQPGRRCAPCRPDDVGIRVNPEREAADAASERSRNWSPNAVRRWTRRHRGTPGHFRPVLTPLRLSQGGV